MKTQSSIFPISVPPAAVSLPSFLKIPSWIVYFSYSNPLSKMGTLLSIFMISVEMNCCVGLYRRFEANSLKGREEDLAPGILIRLKEGNDEKSVMAQSGTREGKRCRAGKTWAACENNSRRRREEKKKEINVALAIRTRLLSTATEREAGLINGMEWKHEKLPVKWEIRGNK